MPQQLKRTNERKIEALKVWHEKRIQQKLNELQNNNENVEQNAKQNDNNQFQLPKTNEKNSNMNHVNTVSQSNETEPNKKINQSPAKPKSLFEEYLSSQEKSKKSAMYMEDSLFEEKLSQQRKIQENVTEEMASLARQMKLNSMSIYNQLQKEKTVILQTNILREKKKT